MSAADVLRAVSDGGCAIAQLPGVVWVFLSFVILCRWIDSSVFFLLRMTAAEMGSQRVPKLNQQSQSPGRDFFAIRVCGVPSGPAGGTPPGAPSDEAHGAPGTADTPLSQFRKRGGPAFQSFGSLCRFVRARILCPDYAVVEIVEAACLFPVARLRGLFARGHESKNGTFNRTHASRGVSELPDASTDADAGTPDDEGAKLDSLRLAAQLHKDTRADLYRLLSQRGLCSSSSSSSTTSGGTSAASTKKKKTASADHRPSHSLTTEDIVLCVEQSLAKRVRERNLSDRAGHAFPTGVNVNEVAAHDSRTPGLSVRQVLRPTDLLCVDFGVHVDGMIIDSALSFSWESHEEAEGGATTSPTGGSCCQHADLLQTVRDATHAGVCAAGADARVSDVSFAIAEVMQAGEVRVPGTEKVFAVCPVRNLNGHAMGRGRIHAGKMVSPVVTGSSQRMKTGEQWAVETFASYGGWGWVFNLDSSAYPARLVEQHPCTHFMLPWKGAGGHGENRASEEEQVTRLPRASAEHWEFKTYLEREFSTLAFCPRWILQGGVKAGTMRRSAVFPQDFGRVASSSASGATLRSAAMESTAGSSFGEAMPSLQQRLVASKPPRGGSGDSKKLAVSTLANPSKVQRLLADLCGWGLLDAYPPLVEKHGSFVAQYEHTLMIKKNGVVEVFTEGMDY